MTMRSPTPKMMIIIVTLFPDLMFLPFLEYVSGNEFGPVLYAIFMI